MLCPCRSLLWLHGDGSAFLVLDCPCQFASLSRHNPGYVIYPFHVSLPCCIFGFSGKSIEELFLAISEHPRNIWRMTVFSCNSNSEKRKEIQSTQYVFNKWGVRLREPRRLLTGMCKYRAWLGGKTLSVRRAVRLWECPLTESLLYSKIFHFRIFHLAFKVNN